jgi:membrane-associated HD superfamily phosphohydrolase
MEDRILDHTAKPEKRMPLAWWKAGLFGGLVGPVALDVILLMQYTEMKSYGPDAIIENGYWLLISQAPIFVATISVTLYGSHINHLVKVILTAFTASMVMLFLMAFSSLILGFPYIASLLEILPAFTTILLGYSFLGYLIWLTFGKLTRFRNQIDSDF